MSDVSDMHISIHTSLREPHLDRKVVIIDSGDFNEPWGMYTDMDVSVIVVTIELIIVI